MSYRSDVPIETNSVRGVSGDLIAMRANFGLLEPVVVSGLNALISGGAYGAGSVPIAQGAGSNPTWFARHLSVASGDVTGIVAGVQGSGVAQWNGSQWQGGVIVSGVRRINGNGAVSGYALVYNSATDVYEPQAVSGSAVSGGSAQPTGEFLVHVTFASGQTQSIPDTINTIVTGMNVTRRNVGGFTVGSGTITVPTGSGYTHIQLFTHLSFRGASGTNVGYRGLQITQNSNSLHHDAQGNPFMAILNRQQSVAELGFFSNVQYCSPFCPVSGGEVYTLLAQHRQGGGEALLLDGGTTQEGANCFFGIRAYKLTSGGVG